MSKVNDASHPVQSSSLHETKLERVAKVPGSAEGFVVGGIGAGVGTGVAVIINGSSSSHSIRRAAAIGWCCPSPFADLPLNIATAFIIYGLRGMGVECELVQMGAQDQRDIDGHINAHHIHVRAHPNNACLFTHLSTSSKSPSL